MNKQRVAALILYWIHAENAFWLTITIGMFLECMLDYVRGARVPFRVSRVVCLSVKHVRMYMLGNLRKVDNPV